MFNCMIVENNILVVDSALDQAVVGFSVSETAELVQAESVNNDEKMTGSELRAGSSLTLIEKMISSNLEIGDSNSSKH